MLDWNFFMGDKVWISQVFIIVFSALSLDFVQRRVLRRLAKQFEKTTNPWDDAVLLAVGKPISALIWVLGISFAAQIISQQAQAPIFAFAEPLRDVGIIAILSWFIVRLIRQVEVNIVAIREAKGESVDITTMDAIAKLLRLSVIITAVLVVLQTLGFSVSGVLAFGGVGGIAVGFAARDLLANFFGGLMIYMDRPFSVGDWVRSPDKEIEGTVEKIGWRLTVIRTFDKRPLYVPNASFASISVENPSRMTNRRIYETIGVRYDDATSIEKIIKDVEAMLRSHPDIDDKQTLMVNFNAFAASSLDFFIYTFTHTTNWIEYHKVKQDVLLKVLNIVTGHGAEVAFPTSTVHVPQGLAVNYKEMLPENA